MASVRKPAQPKLLPENRVVLLEDDQELGFAPLNAFVSEKGNTWFCVPDPRKTTEDGTPGPAHAQYGVTISSKLVGLDQGQLPDAVALYIEDELIEKITLNTGVTGSGNPKRHATVNVDTPMGMRRLTFRVSALPETDDGPRHNMAGSLTRTGGGSGTVAAWS